MAGKRKPRAPSPKIEPPVKKKPTKFATLYKKGKNATIATSVDLTDTPTDTRVETIPTDIPKNVDGKLAEVGISYGMTIGLPRKFEFARIDVDVRIPCGMDEIEETYEKAREWAKDKIRAEILEIRNIEKKGSED